MKISIVTVAYNAEQTIADTIRSVAAQDYPDIEYIVVDGSSKDKTADICRQHAQHIDTFLSEPDQGIFDAMNKGIGLATGDFVGLLNSDDFYEDAGAISRVASKLQESGADSVYGDLVIVDPEDTTKISRYYSAKNFNLKRFEQGDMPPHPTFFVRRSLYGQYGDFNLKYRIVSDFELMLRYLYIHRVSSVYLPGILVRMRGGGNSAAGIRNTMALNAEIKQALQDNGLPASTFKIYSKYFQKALQLIRRPG